MNNKGEEKRTPCAKYARMWDIVVLTKNESDFIIKWLFRGCLKVFARIRKRKIQNKKIFEWIQKVGKGLWKRNFMCSQAG